jgi:hypothetical protein
VRQRSGAMACFTICVHFVRLQANFSAILLSGNIKSVDDQVTRAETLFSNFAAEHNLSFTVSDHFTDLCKKMIQDSKIAEMFACKRTKCTQIIKQAIAPDLWRTLIKRCKKQPFTISKLLNKVSALVTWSSTVFVGISWCNWGFC